MRYFFVIIAFFHFSINSISQEDIKTLLPDPFNLPGLQAAGEPEVYEGDYLFDLINGGADVYFEYGFVQVVTQAYTEMKGNSSVRVEIYQMTDNDAAFGIMSLSATGQNIMENKGVFSVSGFGYKMIHKGDYFIMISYANLDESLRADIVNRVSQDIESKIKKMANYPSIITSTAKPCPNPTRKLYFKGRLALQNATYLDFKIPFKYIDGVFYSCDVFDSMVFKQQADQNTEESTKALINNILQSNPEFSHVKSDDGISILEKDKLRYDILSSEDRIILVKFI